MNDIYTVSTGNMWINPSSGFVGWNENADHFATRKTGLYQINRDGEWITSLVHPTIPKPKLTFIPSNPTNPYYPYGAPPIYKAQIINSKTIYLYGGNGLYFKPGLGFKTSNVIIKSNTGTRINVASLSIPKIIGAAYIIVKLTTPLQDGYKYTLHLPSKYRYFVDFLNIHSVYVVLFMHNRPPIPNN